MKEGFNTDNQEPHGKYFHFNIPIIKNVDGDMELRLDKQRTS